MGTCASIENTHKNKHRYLRNNAPHKHISSRSGNKHKHHHSATNTIHDRINSSNSNSDELTSNHNKSNSLSDKEGASNQNDNDSNSSNDSIINNNNNLRPNNSDHSSNSSLNDDISEEPPSHNAGTSKSNKVKLINNPQSIYLQCPSCKSNTLIISLIFYNSDKHEYYISYTCPCHKVSHKQISIPYKLALTRELPVQFCNEHKENILNYFCLDCKLPTCKDCKYQYHSTKTVRHTLVSSKDIYTNHLHKEAADKIRNKLNSIKRREREFDDMFYEQKQKLKNDFEKIIQRIKVVKTEYEKQMNHKYKEIKFIFAL